MKNLDSDTIAILDGFGFDQIPFDSLQSKIATQGFLGDDSRTTGEIRQPAEDALSHAPSSDDPQRAELARIGQAAIDRGEVGVVVLNGGMATRFGGVPKGVVPVVNGRSFLDYKISQVHRVSGGRSPVFLMNSFATDQVTRTHVEELALGADVRYFHQFVSMRLSQSGDIYKGKDGRPSLYAPGHGDFPYAFAASGELARFMSDGGKYVTLSNVDNLGAALDPAIIGMHISGGTPMSVELVKANPGDVGGFPAYLDGRLAIMEAFRLPAEFDVNSISVFNTNTFVFDAAVLAAPPVLDWFTVLKKVDGEDAVQFERLVGQMTEHLDVNWLVVSREGAGSRFIPIKVVSDVTDRQADLIAVLTSQGVM